MSSAHSTAAPLGTARCTCHSRQAIGRVDTQVTCPAAHRTARARPAARPRGVITSSTTPSCTATTPESSSGLTAVRRPGSPGRRGAAVWRRGAAGPGAAEAGLGCVGLRSGGVGLRSGGVGLQVLGLQRVSSPGSPGAIDSGPGVRGAAAWRLAWWGQGLQARAPRRPGAHSSAASSPSRASSVSSASTATVGLHGQAQSNGRLWRWLARAAEAVGGRRVSRPLPGSAELPKAATHALRRHRSRAGVLPRGQSDPAGGRLRASRLRGLGRLEQHRQPAGADVAPLQDGGGRGAVLAHHLEPAAYAMVRATYGTPEACTRTAYVQCVGPRGKLPSGAYGTQGADTRHGCRACQHGLEQ
eukprot:scaffold68793_cov52-Phaeocystis_antarctica.AAC.3